MECDRVHPQVCLPALPREGPVSTSSRQSSWGTVAISLSGTWQRLPKGRNEVGEAKGVDTLTPAKPLSILLPREVGRDTTCIP